MNNDLTITEARRLFSYCPETGEVTRKVQARYGGGPVGSVVGSKNGDGYLQVCVDYKIYTIHRLAWLLYYGKWPNGQIDHVKGVRDDNRITELRDTDSLGNHLNMGVPTNNTSGFVGVTWDKNNNKWMAKIKVSSRTINLGRFPRKSDAVLARCAAEDKYGFHANHGTRDSNNIIALER